MMSAPDTLHAMDPTPPSLEETNRKLDELVFVVARLAAGLASGTVGAPQPAQDADASPAAGRSFSRFSELTANTDPERRSERLAVASSENLPRDAAKTLATWGGRGLYRMRRSICMERSVEFRRYLIEDAMREDVEEAKRMGADLLMDRGAEMAAPPTLF